MYVYKSMYAKSVVNLRQTIDTHEHVFERKNTRKHYKTKVCILKVATTSYNKAKNVHLASAGTVGRRRFLQSEVTYSRNEVLISCIYTYIYSIYTMIYICIYIYLCFLFIYIYMYESRPFRGGHRPLKV